MLENICLILFIGGFRPVVSESVDSSNAFGEDMLQMALKMATGELDEPAVDLETALTPNTITATQAPSQPDSIVDADGKLLFLIHEFSFCAFF